MVATRPCFTFPRNFQASLTQSPMSLIVHNIGDAVVVEADLNQVLVADVTANADRVRAARVSSLSEPPAVLQDAAVPEPLLLLTNHAANTPFSTTLLQRNESLQRDADLLLRLAALQTSPSLRPADAPAIPDLPPYSSTKVPCITETAISVYSTPNSRVIGLQTSGVKAVASLGDSSLDESSFALLSRLVSVDLWLNAGFNDSSDVDRDAALTSQEIVTTGHKYTYSSTSMSYFASLLTFLKVNVDASLSVWRIT
jgi:hypothetical protein